MLDRRCPWDRRIEVSGILSIDELICLLIAVRQLFSKCDEELAEWRMLLHEVHAVQIFLSSGDMIRLIPERLRGNVVPIEIGKE